MTSISKSIRLLPRYILNPINSYYLRGYDASLGHQPLPEPWSTLPTSWPASNSCLQPVHSPYTTVVIFKKHLRNYITPLLKALQVLPTIITLKTHSLCQGLQVFWDLDPPSSFPIMRQSHWPTSGPSNPAADLYLTAFVPAHPSTYNSSPRSGHNSLFALSHDSGQTPTPLEGLP